MGLFQQLRQEMMRTLILFISRVNWEERIDARNFKVVKRTGLVTVVDTVIQAQMPHEWCSVAPVAGSAIGIQPSAASPFRDDLNYRETLTTYSDWWGTAPASCTYNLCSHTVPRAQKGPTAWFNVLLFCRRPLGNLNFQIESCIFVLHWTLQIM